MDTIFIPSKGRAKNCQTHRNFEAFDMHDWIYVVEPQEYWDYVQRLRRDGVYMPETHVYAFDLQTFKSPLSEDNPLGYDYMDDFGWRQDLTTGPGPARNALHHLAKELGLKHYWMMDDDIAMFSIDGFFCQKGVWTKDKQDGGVENSRLSLIDVFELYERMLDKFSNIGLAEMDKQGLVQNHRKNCHFSVNCKAYSCIRFSTDIDIPWRSRYNDDIMISLDYEKRGYVNVSSKAVSYMTPSSQSQAGGMTEAFHQEGTLRKVKYLVKAYPEHSFFTLRYGRFHHFVDYSKYDQTLHRRDGLEWLDDLKPDTWNPYDAFVPKYADVDQALGESLEDQRELHWKNVDNLLMAMYMDDELSKHGYFADSTIPEINITDVAEVDTEELLGVKRVNEVPAKEEAKDIRSKIASEQDRLFRKYGLIKGDVPAVDVEDDEEDVDLVEDDNEIYIESDETHSTDGDDISDETVVSTSDLDSGGDEIDF